MTIAEIDEQLAGADVELAAAQQAHDELVAQLQSASNRLKSAKERQRHWTSKRRQAERLQQPV